MIYVALFVILWTLFAVMGDELLMEKGGIFFMQLVACSALYFLIWGVSGLGSWIWMTVTSVLGGTMAADLVDE